MMLRKYLRSLALLCVPFCSHVLGECPTSPAVLTSSTLDTIAPGTVKVTNCYSTFWVMNRYATDTCMTDTTYQLALLDSLKASYSRMSHAVVARVDTVIYYPDTIWWEDCYRESVLVVIDSNLKPGSLPSSMWLTYLPCCQRDYRVFYDRPFVTFFDSLDTISSLRVEPGYFLNPTAYFLVGSDIVCPAFPGVSVKLDDFLSAMRASIGFRRNNVLPVLTRPGNAWLRSATTTICTPNGRFLEFNKQTPTAKLPTGLYLSFIGGPPRLRCIVLSKWTLGVAHAAAFSRLVGP